MSHSNPNWYESLQDRILKERTFTDQLVQNIITRSYQKKSIWNDNIIRYSFFSFVILTVLGIIFFFRISNHSTLMDEYIGPQLTDVVQGGQAPTNHSIEPQTQGDIDNSKVPSDENFVPRSVHALNSDSTLEESKIAAQIDDKGILLRTTYTSSSGVEITFTQGPTTMDEDQTLNYYLKNMYTNENMEVTQINGHAAAYVDGEKRRVVHLFTNKHIFTAATYNGAIDDCKNILEQIQLKGE